VRDLIASHPIARIAGQTGRDGTRRAATNREAMCRANIASVALLTASWAPPGDATLKRRHSPHSIKTKVRWEKWRRRGEEGLALFLMFTLLGVRSLQILILSPPVTFSL